MKKKDVKIGSGMSVSKGKEKEMKERAGGSNVGKYKTVSKKDFAGPSGGAPKGSYPINTEKRAKAALSYARNAPDPAGIKSAVYRKYPRLRKRHEEREGKK